MVFIYEGHKWKFYDGFILHLQDMDTFQLYKHEKTAESNRTVRELSSLAKS